MDLQPTKPRPVHRRATLQEKEMWLTEEMGFERTPKSFLHPESKARVPMGWLTKHLSLAVFQYAVVETLRRARAKRAEKGKR
jgi:hypothetical protein